MSGSNGTAAVIPASDLPEAREELLPCEFCSAVDSEWRCVPITAENGLYLRYAVSDCGKVMSLGGRQGATPGLILVPYSRGSERGKTYCVNLRTPGERFPVSVHTLVLCAFEGARPSGKTANHKDRNRRHNCYHNLEWATPTEQQIHRYQHNGNGETLSVGEACKRRNGNGKRHDEKPVEEMSQEEAAEAFPF